MIRPALGAMLVVASLLVISAAQGSGAVVSAKGVVSGSGNTWTITIENTGTEPIRCFKFFLASGVLARGPGSRAGWQLGTQGQVVFGKSDAGISPGGTERFTFPTTVPYPSNAGGKLNVSADCQTDVTGTVTGPTASNSSPPAAKPCTCKDVTVRINPKTLEFDQRRNKTRLKLRLDLDWRLTCTTGAGTCTGTLHARPLTFGGKLLAGNGKVNCKGECSATNRGFKRWVLLDPGLGFGDRGAYSPNPDSRRTELDSEILITRSCQGKPLRPVVLTIRYTLRTGNVDFKRSDLDGNGRGDYTGKKL